MSQPDQEVIYSTPRSHSPLAVSIDRTISAASAPTALLPLSAGFLAPSPSFSSSSRSLSPSPLHQLTSRAATPSPYQSSFLPSPPAAALAPPLYSLGGAGARQGVNHSHSHRQIVQPQFVHGPAHCLLSEPRPIYPQLSQSKHPSISSPPPAGTSGPMAVSMMQQQRAHHHPKQQQQPSQSSQPSYSGHYFAVSAALSLGRPFSPNDFEIFNTLGTGTFGRVYLCRLRSNPNAYFALKVMQKSEILRLKQLDHIFSEKMILSNVHFPFVVQLYATFQNQRNIYMLLEYAMGGELFSYLRKLGRFSLEATRFYASEILLAIEYLHYQNIIYRDLKPENLLLDVRGHIKITDFGFAKYVPDRTWTLCGTPEYLAPEIIQGRGHGKEVDWWALGILIYEMLVGYPPFYDTSPFGIYEKILAGNLRFPDFVDPVSRDLISKLLLIEKSQRLGNLKNGSVDIKQHPWFKEVDWQSLYHRTAATPFVPRYMYPGDSGNFEPYPELIEEPIPEWESDPFQHLFLGF